MMTDFDIKRCTRRCAATDRLLLPGEVFYSALVQDGADLIRQDYSAAAWEGPPDNSVGAWKSQMPAAGAKRVKLAPNEVMRNLFVELESQPEKRELRYLLTLVLIRRRVLQLEGEETDEQGGRQMRVHLNKEESLLVPVAEPVDEAHADQLQQELTSLLYAETE